MNFDNIEYLQHGTSRQQQAFSLLTENRMLHKLERFDPILAGTIPINIDIENSDLDIICCFSNKAEFIKAIVSNFENQQHFAIRERPDAKHPAVIANFFLDDFEIEIFGQDISTQQQNAYRHMMVEYKLLQKNGEPFRQKIIALKRQGIKTEPAFAAVLGINGDPYEELLKLES